jgi:ABC-type Mn2+/Zn2+ transport system ATPase subunit
MNSGDSDATAANDAGTSTELLRFENASIGYGRRTILRDLDFSICSGDYLAIVGSNGSGKTTLLRAMLGLLKPLSGSIGAVAGRTLHYGYVPQLQAVDEYFPLTVSEVVLMGRYGRLGALHRPAKADHERAQAALDEVGIQHLSTRLYRELSGGQKQRALIARALASDPDLLVLDEHTNDLDIASEKAIMALIDGLHAERGLAVVMVSHSLNTVVNHCSNIGIISGGECRFAPVENVLQPEYLEQLYGVPLRVLEMEGTRVVV